MHKIRKPTRRRSVLATLRIEATALNLMGQAINKANLRMKRLKATLNEQKLINRMTNWQRSQWGRPMIKNKEKTKGYRPECIQHFLNLQRR